jgi:hypothetical protein
MQVFPIYSKSSLPFLFPPCYSIDFVRKSPMFYLQDKALKQIAEELNISINTIKSQKQRAVQLLKNRTTYITIMIVFYSFYL